jgi:hypothetical protein
MPVTKYRSVADMPRPRSGRDETLVLRIRTLWNRAFVLSPPAFPRGLRRYRSIEEANAARAEATHERMRSRGRKRVTVE